MKKIKINITENKQLLSCGHEVSEGCGCDAAAPEPAASVPALTMSNAHNGEEGRMHRTNLAQLHAKSLKLLGMIEDSDDLPEWVESKITKAADYISSIENYLNGNLAREVGALEEKKNCGCGQDPCKTYGLQENKLKKNFSEGLIYHLDNNIPVNENIFRPGSEQFFRLFKEVRSLYESGMYDLEEEEKFYILETTNLGEWDLYEGEKVPLEYPFLYEDEELEEAKYQGKEVRLGKNGAKRSGNGRAYVYVRDKSTGKVKKVSFGSSMPDAMGKSPAAKKRRKNFGDRHKCADKKDNTKAGYWSCRATKMFGRSIPGWW